MDTHTPSSAAVIHSEPDAYVEAISGGALSAETRKRPKIVFLSASNPCNRKRWSGTVTSIFLALRRRDQNIQFITGGPVEFAARFARRLLLLLGIKLELGFSRPLSRVGGCWVSARLAALDADAVVVVAASSYLAFLRTRKPIIYISDTTFAAILRLYPEFREFPGWLRRHGDDLERRSLRRANYVIYPSEWAKQSAVQDYGVDRGIIHVLPFGPNLSKGTLERFRTVKTAEFGHSIRILHVSADWQRKNGDLVLEIGRILRRDGFQCQLFLVGRIPATVRSGDGVCVVGSLDKNDPADLARLCELYEAAHFFILPTTADASPIVFSEAQAFGCPAITYDVGGTSTAVLDNETGIVLPLTATADDFACRIEQLIEHPVSYERMSRSARRRYEESANWDAWAATIERLASPGA